MRNILHTTVAKNIHVSVLTHFNYLFANLSILHKQNDHM